MELIIILFIIFLLGFFAYFSIPLLDRIKLKNKKGKEIKIGKDIVYGCVIKDGEDNLSDFTQYLNENGSQYLKNI